MPINGRALFDAFIILAKKEKMRTTVFSSLGSGLVVSTSVGVGLFFGPLGPAVGGAIGSLGMYLLTKNKYKSVADVLMNDLTAREQEQLIRLLEEAFKNFTIQDALQYSEFLLLPHSRSQLVKDHALKIILGFLADYKSQPQLTDESLPEFPRDTSPVRTSREHS